MSEKNGDVCGNKWTSQQSARLRFSRSFPLISYSPASTQTWLSGALAFVLLPPTTTRLPLMVLAWTPSAGQSWAQGGAWCEDISDPPLLLCSMCLGNTPQFSSTSGSGSWPGSLVSALGPWCLPWVPGVCPTGWWIVGIQFPVAPVPEPPHPEHPVWWRGATLWQACETNPGFCPFWKKKGV